MSSRDSGKGGVGAGRRAPVATAEVAKARGDSEDSPADGGEMIGSEV